MEHVEPGWFCPRDRQRGHRDVVALLLAQGQMRRQHRSLQSGVPQGETPAAAANN